MPIGFYIERTIKITNIVVTIDNVILADASRCRNIIMLNFFFSKGGFWKPPSLSYWARKYMVNDGGRCSVVFTN